MTFLVTSCKYLYPFTTLTSLKEVLRVKKMAVIDSSKSPEVKQQQPPFKVIIIHNKTHYPSLSTSTSSPLLFKWVCCRRRSNRFVTTTLLSVVWSQLITACSQNFCSQSLTALMSQILRSHLLEFNISPPGCFITWKSLLKPELYYYVQCVILWLFTFSWHLPCFELLHSNYGGHLRSWNRLFLGWDGSPMITVALVFHLLVKMSSTQCSVIQPWPPSGDRECSVHSLTQAGVTFWCFGSMFFHSSTVEGPCHGSRLLNWACWHCEGCCCDPKKHIRLSFVLHIAAAFLLVSVNWCGKEDVFNLRTETGVRRSRLKHVRETWNWSVRDGGPHLNVALSLDHRWVVQNWHMLVPHGSFPIKSTAFSLKSNSIISLKVKL